MNAPECVREHLGVAGVDAPERLIGEQTTRRANPWPGDLGSPPRVGFLDIERRHLPQPSHRVSPRLSGAATRARSASMSIFARILSSARQLRASAVQGALLLARIYEVLPLLCPACGGEMKILAFLTDPHTVRAILLHLDLPHTPPPLAPARGPPQPELLFDQTPGFDPTDPEPIPDFDFDQSLPDAWQD